MTLDIIFHNGEFCTSKAAGSDWSADEQSDPFMLYLGVDVPSNMGPSDSIEVGGRVITGEQLGIVENG